MWQNWIEFELRVRGVRVHLNEFGQWLLADLPYCADHTSHYYLRYEQPLLGYHLFFTPYDRYDFALQLGVSATNKDFALIYHQGIVRMIAQDLYSALERRGFRIEVVNSVSAWHSA
jgi:hypothetical protein